MKYVCCNADEGDPGAFMDRSVLEGDPHAVIEAMAIAGYAIGANQGYIYVRAEYPIAVKRLQIAIEQAREYGLLGKNIFWTPASDFDLELRLGAGAFVCGEETALMTSIEGKRGEPRPRPPFPAVKGLFGKPTLLNNVETYANIPRIISTRARSGSPPWAPRSPRAPRCSPWAARSPTPAWWRSPWAPPCATIIEDIGGGIPNGKKFKAAQTGGPSGGCIPAELIDTPIDYDNLIAIGSMMGSGGLIVMDEDNCMVDIAKFFLEFTRGRVLRQVHPLPHRHQAAAASCWTRSPTATARMEDLDTHRGAVLPHQGQPPCAAWARRRPTRCCPPCATSGTSTMAHVVEKRCPAGVCKNLLQL